MRICTIGGGTHTLGQGIHQADARGGPRRHGVPSRTRGRRPVSPRPSTSTPMTRGGSRRPLGPLVRCNQCRLLRVSCPGRFEARRAKTAIRVHLLGAPRASATESGRGATLPTVPAPKRIRPGNLYGPLKARQSARHGARVRPHKIIRALQFFRLGACTADGGRMLAPAASGEDAPLPWILKRCVISAVRFWARGRRRRRRARNENTSKKLGEKLIETSREAARLRRSRSACDLVAALLRIQEEHSLY